MADGQVIYEIRGDDSKLDGDLGTANDKVKKSSGVLSGIAKGTAMAVGGAFVAAGAAAVAFGSKGVQLASDLSEVQNVVDTTFGDGADKINKWAKNAAESFGLSELSAKQMTGTMGAMLKSMGLAPKNVEEMSTSIAGLAGDFASFYNLDSEEAFEKIRSGISGETEPLKQLGINMSVANLEAYALSEGISKSYDSMTQAEQATLRYNYLMSVSADAQGDFAKTSDSLANKQRIMSMQIDSLAATIGETLLPIASEAVGAITEMLGDEDSKAWLNDLFSGIAKVAEEALPLLIEAAGKLLTALEPLLTNMLEPAMALLTGLIEPITSLISSLLPPMIELFSMLSEPLMQIINEIMPVLIDVLNQLMPPIMELISALLPPLLDVFNALMEPCLELIKMLLPPLVDLLKMIIPIIESLSPLISVLAEALGKTLSGAFEIVLPIIETVIGILDAIGDVLKGVIDFITGVFTGDWDKAWNGIVEIFRGILNYVPQILESVINGAIGLINNLIKGINGITGTVGITAIPSIPDVQIPRFKTGIDYVPSDDMPALLHRGEAVLTADEAAIYRSLGGKGSLSEISAFEKGSDDSSKNISITNNNYSPKALSPKEIYQNEKKIVQRLAGGL
ncbi:MAG TPA: hypothetical protein PKI60_06930 [Oscillospiraceae bacterium]|nr:hypothetical protein [Oscillospiraceae bacterium]